MVKITLDAIFAVIVFAILSVAFNSFVEIFIEWAMNTCNKRRKEV